MADEIITNQVAEAPPVVVEPVVSPPVESAAAPVAEAPKPFWERATEKYADLADKNEDYLLDDYGQVRGKVAQYEQQVAELSTKFEQATAQSQLPTPALGVLADYQRSLVAAGETNPDVLNEKTFEMYMHLKTDYSKLADTNPAALIGMKIRAEYEKSGFSEERIQAKIARIAAPSAEDYDLDNPAQKAEYEDKYDEFIMEAKNYAAEMEKTKKALDFKPHGIVTPEEEAVGYEQRAQAFVDKFTKTLSTAPKSITFAGVDIPVELTPSLQARYEAIKAEPYTMMYEIFGVDKDGIPDPQKMFEFSVLYDQLPAILAKQAADAKRAGESDATKAMEASLHNTARTTVPISNGGGGGEATGLQSEMFKKTRW